MNQHWNHKISTLLLILFCGFHLFACGQGDDEYIKFKKALDSFCGSVSDINARINGTDPSSSNQITDILYSLDDLDKAFRDFSALDFPMEFDYLETTADEAADYMTEAVKSFHQAFETDYNSEESFRAQYNYARENYSRAYKRLQIILSFLHGENPQDVLIK